MPLVAKGLEKSRVRNLRESGSATVSDGSWHAWQTGWLCAPPGSRVGRAGRRGRLFGLRSVDDGERDAQCAHPRRLLVLMPPHASDDVGEKADRLGDVRPLVEHDALRTLPHRRVGSSTHFGQRSSIDRDNRSSNQSPSTSVGGGGAIRLNCRLVSAAFKNSRFSSAM